MNTAALSELGLLRRNETGQVFEEPWQALAFAIVVRLQGDGHFSWQEWTARLGGELKQAGPGDRAEDYYQHWLDALERLVQDEAMLGAADLKDRLQYLREHPVPHDHVAKREPVFVSKASG
jgi:nitrile hydratase accessory protein